MATTRKLSDDELIEKYVEPDPNDDSPAFWRLKEEEMGVPVWALIAVLADDESNAEQVAQDYRISPEAMDAALAYYRRKGRYIDAWNLLNSGEEPEQTRNSGEEERSRGRVSSSQLSDEKLIEHYLEPDPNTGDPAEWRLKDEEMGYPVWSIIAVLVKDLSNAEQVIHDYRISPEALEAAWAYYRCNDWIIDARILSNRTA